MEVARLPEPGIPEIAIRSRFEEGVCSYLSSEHYPDAAYLDQDYHNLPQHFVTRRSTCSSMIPTHKCRKESHAIVEGEMCNLKIVDSSG